MMMTLMIGLFVLGGVSAYGQLAENPATVVLPDDPAASEPKTKTLYESVATNEARDIVMVGSTMPYFIMPDVSFNFAYFNEAQNPKGYEGTEKTRSWFDWEFPAGASHMFVNPNNVLRPPVITDPADYPFNPVYELKGSEAGTSPWIRVTWGDPGDTYLKVREFPEMLFTSPACKSTDTVTIPISVIAQPTMAFMSVGPADKPFSFFACVPNVNATNPYTINFPVEGFTQSSDLKVTYTLQVYELDGLTLRRTASGTFGTAADSDDKMTAGTKTNPYSDTIEETPITSLDYVTNEYGVYVLSINKITDLISIKCDIDITAGIEENDTITANVFTFNVIPQPKAGRTYHIPNSFPAP